MPITMTENAKKKIDSIKNKRQTPDAYFRAALKSGGCSGFSYHYDLVPAPDKGDKIFDFGDIKVCIDRKSYLFLNGTEIDYVDTLMSSGFCFNNPLAKRSCSCGESFTI